MKFDLEILLPGVLSPEIDPEIFLFFPRIYNQYNLYIEKKV